MRPRGLPSGRVKICPWYYTERKQPSRHAELREALEFESRAEEDDFHDRDRTWQPINT